MPRKSGTSGLGRGRRKRTRTTGTSSATYFTSRRVLGEPAGAIPAGHPSGHGRRDLGLWILGDDQHRLYQDERPNHATVSHRVRTRSKRSCPRDPGSRTGTRWTSVEGVTLS